MNPPEPFGDATERLGREAGDGTDPDPLEAALGAAFGSGNPPTLPGGAPVVAAEIAFEGEEAVGGGSGLPRRTRRYEIGPELARGGIGRIFLARDLDIGRDVALKVLREEVVGRQDLYRRLVEEAQICGQIQHPGVVPVYEVGLLGPRRPFIAMKLIRGATLAELLAARTGPGDDLPRHLAVFEKICQTVAFAHARRVVHRDLKPSNVMVGSFGEVQVMDWGLAKVLGEGTDEGGADGFAAGPGVTTLRTGRGGLESEAGVVLGTPAYMAPEQARGESGAIDERADVFALGAILFEILTGARVYGTGTPDEIRTRAETGALAPAWERLAAMPAGGGGIEDLARRCLAADPAARPRDAAAVSRAFEEWSGAAAERARAAEIAAAESGARAAEERRARRLTAALATAIIVAMVAVGGGFLWIESDRKDRARETAASLAGALEEAHRLLGVAERAGTAALLPWEDAHAAARRAEAVAEAGEADAGARRVATSLREDVERRRAEARARFETAGRDRLMARRIDGIRAQVSEPERSHEAFREAFADYGIAVGESDPGPAVAKLRASAIREPLLAALDDWVFERRRMAGRSDAVAAALRRMLDAADDDPLRGRVRAAVAAAETESLAAIAADPATAAAPSYTVTLLASSLRALDAEEPARALLERAWTARPDDFWIQSHLGHALLVAGRAAEAARCFAAATALRPESYAAWTNLGNALDRQGLGEAALASHERALALNPAMASLHSNLGACLVRRGDLDRAGAAYGRALAIDPGLGEAIEGVAAIHERRGELEEAERKYRDAVAAAPRRAALRFALAAVLRKRGDHEEAENELRETLRLAPDHLMALTNLGARLREKGEPGEAEPLLRRAIALRPERALAHLNLAQLLIDRPDPDGALAILAAAERVEPAHPSIPALRGLAHLRKWDPQAAEAAFRESLARDPDSAEGLRHLATALELRGRPAEALEALGRIGSGAPRRPGSRDRDPELEARIGKLAAAEARFEEFLDGRTAPSGEAEGLGLARLAVRRGRLGAAVGFYAAVVDAPPGNRPSLRDGVRFEAARTAVRAGTGLHAKEPGPERRAEWRSLALRWFQREVSILGRRVEDRRVAAAALAVRLWLDSPDFAPVRDPASLAGLPAAEAESWSSAWEEARTLLVELDAAAGR